MAEKKIEKMSSKYYDTGSAKVKRNRMKCPRCGEGVFLAEHKNRLSCGKCGYTEFKK